MIEMLFPRKFPFPDGVYLKRGSECEFVFRNDERHVTKLLKKDSSKDVIEKMKRHNALFGDKTEYVIHDDVLVNGRVYWQLRQPYVEFVEDSWAEAREKLFYDMKMRFGDAEEHPWRPNELHLPDWLLDDLKPANVGIDSRTHNYAVIDCIIHASKEMPDEFLWDIDRKQRAIDKGE